MGAYHKHFQIKPAIKLNGGLKTGKDKGVHDSDYYLEVTATNKALLSTVLSKKVGIFIPTTWFKIIKQKETLIFALYLR